MSKRIVVKEKVNIDKIFEMIYNDCLYSDEEKMEIDRLREKFNNMEIDKIKYIEMDEIINIYYRLDNKEIKEEREIIKIIEKLGNLESLYEIGRRIGKEDGYWIQRFPGGEDIMGLYYNSYIKKIGEVIKYYRSVNIDEKEKIKAILEDRIAEKHENIIEKMKVGYSMKKGYRDWSLYYNKGINSWVGVRGWGHDEVIAGFKKDEDSKLVQDGLYYYRDENNSLRVIGVKNEV